MKILIVLLGTLFVVLLAYRDKEGILQLDSRDLNELSSISNRLFVKYYVPWCRHCQKLEHVFIEVAQKLKHHHIEIQLAEIDCQEHSQAFQFEQIDHYPTLVYYEDGKKTHFDGERTVNYIYKWLRHRVFPPVKTITKEELVDLHGTSTEGARIVYFGSLEGEAGQRFKQFASFDHYNDYYNIQEDSSEEKGTVRMMRSFAADVRVAQVDDSFGEWVRQNDQPSVVAWDERAIFHIFRDGHTGIFYFAMHDHYFVVNEFILASQEWKAQVDANHNITFAIVNEMHEDYFGFLQYLQMNPKDTPVVIIEGSKLNKFVLKKSITQLTTSNIQNFLKDYFAGKIQGEPLDNGNSHHHHHHHDHDHAHEHVHDHQPPQENEHRPPEEEKDQSAAEQVEQHYNIHRNFQKLVYDKTEVPEGDKEPEPAEPETIPPLAKSEQL